MTRAISATLALLIAAGLGAVMAEGTHVMNKEPRFPQLTMGQLTDAQKPLAEEIMKVSSVGLGGPYNPLLRSPVLGQRMFDLLHYLRWETSVPLKLNEFAILIIGRQWRSQRAKKLLGEQQVVDLTTVAGTYISIATLLAMSEESVPPGRELPFKLGEP